MADNTTLNTGVGGDTLATDDISGVKYPRSKITLGADGVNDGDVSAANPLPVSVASIGLPTGASTAAHQVTQTTHLATLAGAVAGTEVQVDVLTLPTVTIADGGGTITIDGTVTANAGSGTFAVSAAALPLPTGAATSANQVTELASLASIDG
ncbi:MAG: hypothetical protein ACKO0Z_17445, partial [Betaproteobacteria bacterium]